MKNLKINVPEEYEIDKEASTFENIVFKKKEFSLPKRWEELKTIGGYYVSTRSNVESIGGDFNLDLAEDLNTMKNLFATKEQAEAALALAQLSQLLKAYNNGWEPNWTDCWQGKYVIYISKGRITKYQAITERHFLAFKDGTARDLFLENFRDLIEQAKPLL